MVTLNFMLFCFDCRGLSYYIGRLLCPPLCKFPLPFLTLIEGQNVWQDAAGNGFNLMLWYGGVID